MARRSAPHSYPPLTPGLGSMTLSRTTMSAAVIMIMVVRVMLLVVLVVGMVMLTATMEWMVAKMAMLDMIVMVIFVTKIMFMKVTLCCW